MASDEPEFLRVQIASDLHLEFYDELPPFKDLLRPSAPVLGLLGDICALGHRRGRALYEAFLQECCKHFEQVLCLVGNHEFYSDEIAQVTYDEILSYMHGLSAKFPKVLLLENDGLTINDVRIVGTALWSSVPDEQTIDGAERLGRSCLGTVEGSMNDYNLVYVPCDLGPDAANPAGSQGGPRKARVKDTNAWHRRAVKFLHEEASQATLEKRNMLVLTHHTPSFRGTSNPRHGVDPNGISTAFSTNLEHMLTDPELGAIHSWCFGHTHYNSDQHMFGRRLVSNQRGYPERLAHGYKRNFVIEVPRVRVDGDSPPRAGASAERRTDSRAVAGGCCEVV